MKVLIIQQKMIGDVLATSIIFEAIKQQHPNADLHYLINTHTYPVVEGNPFIYKFHFFTPEHEKSKRKLFAFAKKLKLQNYDAVIDVYSKFSSAIISYITNAKIRVSKYKWYTSFLYNQTYKELKTPTTNAGLAIENRLKMLKALGVNSKIIKPKIYLTQLEITDAKNVLQTCGIDLTKPLFMIGVLGSSANKTYPFDYMANVIDMIVNKSPKSQILFNYIPKQENDAKAIYNLCSEKTKRQIFLNLYGKNLRQFLALTYHCNALIGNEGGATNMAKALNLATFTIFSPWIIKEAWNMFDDDKQNVSVHLKDFKPKLFIRKPTKELKQNSETFYKAFSPHFFEKKLIAFLDLLDTKDS